MVMTSAVLRREPDASEGGADHLASTSLLPRGSTRRHGRQLHCASSCVRRDSLFLGFPPQRRLWPAPLFSPGRACGNYSDPNLGLPPPSPRPPLPLFMKWVASDASAHNGRCHTPHNKSAGKMSLSCRAADAGLVAPPCRGDGDLNVRWRPSLMRLAAAVRRHLHSAPLRMPVVCQFCHLLASDSLAGSRRWRPLKGHINGCIRQGVACLIPDCLAVIEPHIQTHTGHQVAVLLFRASFKTGKYIYIYF